MRSTLVRSWSMALVALLVVPGCTYDGDSRHDRGADSPCDDAGGDAATAVTTRADAVVTDASQTVVTDAATAVTADAATTDPECVAGGGACVLDRDCCTGGCSGVAASGARYCEAASTASDGGTGDDAASHGGSDGAASCTP